MFRPLFMKLIKPSLIGTRRFFSSNAGLWDALTIKHSWLKITPGQEPHSTSGTVALKKLITDEASDSIRNTNIMSLPKGKKLVAFSPAPGVADHAFVFDKIPESAFFKSQIIPKITEHGSAVKNVGLSSDIDSCLSEKIDETSNAYLIHLRFLRGSDRNKEKTIQEKITPNYSY